MTRTSLQDFNCSLARTVDLIGDKWSLLILRDAFYGYSQFSDFRNRLGITPTVLTARLQALTNAGILQRDQVREGIDRHHYRLTAKGRDLLPTIISLVQWGDKWIFEEEGPPIVLRNRQTGNALARMEVCDSAGKVLAPRNVTFEAGPGATAETRAAVRSARASDTGDTAK